MDNRYQNIEFYAWKKKSCRCVLKILKYMWQLSELIDDMMITTPTNTDEYIEYIEYIDVKFNKTIVAKFSQIILFSAVFTIESQLTTFRYH